MTQLKEDQAIPSIVCSTLLVTKIITFNLIQRKKDVYCVLLHAGCQSPSLKLVRFLNRSSTIAS